MLALKQHWRRQLAASAFGGKRPKLRKPGRPTPPLAQEEAYTRELQAKFVEPYREAAERILIPRLPMLVAQAERERRDAGTWRSNLDKVVELVSATHSAEQTHQTAVKAATAMAAGVNRRNAEEVHRMLVRAVGVDVWQHEPHLNEFTARTIKKNVDYITTIKTQQLQQVAQVVEAGIRRGLRVEVIAKDIEKRFDVSASRAKLIARDQVGSFNGELMQMRQQGLGVEGYFWRGMLDSRERDEHVEREGERFAWADPPDGGHPGDDFQCRCTAEPDFSFLERP